MQAIKMKEIAARISAHLKRFEADPEINKRKPSGIPPYFRAGSVASGSYVYVTYVSFQGDTALRKTIAAKYLAWLDAGNEGTHHAFLRAEEV